MSVWQFYKQARMQKVRDNSEIFASIMETHSVKAALKGLISQKCEKYDGSSFYSEATVQKATSEAHNEALAIFKRMAATYNPAIIAPFAKTIEKVFH